MNDARLRGCRPRPDDLSASIKSAHVIDAGGFIGPNYGWDCGPAVYLMARKAFGLEEQTHEDVIRLMHTTPERGTDNADLLSAFESWPGFEVLCKTGGRVNDLFQLLSDRYLVAINYLDPYEPEQSERGHYGIVQGITAQGLSVCDPSYGPDRFISFQEFEWTSQFTEPILAGWYLALRLQISGSK